MSKQPSLLIDLLGIGRVANLPSVITNLCVGMTAGIASYCRVENPLTILNYQIFLSGIFLYLAGCILNDLADDQWDQKNKPSRPIASKRVKKTPLIILAITFLPSVAQPFFTRRLVHTVYCLDLLLL